MLQENKHTWRWADVRDITNIVNLAEQQFQGEIDHILTCSPHVYAYNVDRTLTEQRHRLDKEQILVNYNGDELQAYSWIGRGTYTHYSNDEIAEGKFIHMDLTLSSRKRIELLKDTLVNWEAWARAINIPVLVSTSVRREQTAFMRIHERMGYDVRGAIAYKRIKEMKCEQ